MPKSYVEPRCPLRPQDKCSLCQPGASGPHDCGLVYLVRGDDELHDLAVAARQAQSKR